MRFVGLFFIFVYALAASVYPAAMLRRLMPRDPWRADDPQRVQFVRWLGVLVMAGVALSIVAELLR